MSIYGKHEGAKCRNCGLKLLGKPYAQMQQVTNPNTREACKQNYYGGYVCSKRCDYEASLELERSMPGHGGGQKTIGADALKHYNRNWNQP